MRLPLSLPERFVGLIAFVQSDEISPRCAPDIVMFFQNATKVEKTFV